MAVRNKTDANLRTSRASRWSEAGEGRQRRHVRRLHRVAGAASSDDLMTQLLNAEFEDEHGETADAHPPGGPHLHRVIAGAGNETTGRLIGWLAKVLAEHPDQRRGVVEDRSLIPNVIDETLRFEPTGHATARYVTQDVEYYGTTVPAGSPILLLSPRPTATPAGTRQPDSFDIHRDGHPAPHLRLRPALLPRRNLARLEGGSRSTSC